MHGAVYCRKYHLSQAGFATMNAEFDPLWYCIGFAFWAVLSSAVAIFDNSRRRYGQRDFGLLRAILSAAFSGLCVAVFSLTNLIIALLFEEQGVFPAWFIEPCIHVLCAGFFPLAGFGASSVGSAPIQFSIAVLFWTMLDLVAVRAAHATRIDWHSTDSDNHPLP